MCNNTHIKIYILKTSIDLIKENGFTLKKTRSRWYPVKIITDVNYTDDLALLTNIPVLAGFLLHSQEQVTRHIGLYVNAIKKEFMCFKKEGAFSTLNGKCLKLVDQFTYLGSNISSTERECVDCYWEDISHMESWSLWWNKMRFLPSCQ